MMNNTREPDGPLGRATADPFPTAGNDGQPLVQPAQFTPLVPAEPGPAVSTRNLALLLDVTLDVVAELGRTRMLVRDVLNLASGSIVELDKLAGEPVNVLVNGALIARGEVVVVDEQFGIRISEIVAAANRLDLVG